LWVSQSCWLCSKLWMYSCSIARTVGSNPTQGICTSLVFVMCGVGSDPCDERTTPSEDSYCVCMQKCGIVRWRPPSTFSLSVTIILCAFYMLGFNSFGIDTVSGKWLLTFQGPVVPLSSGAQVDFLMAKAQCYPSISCRYHSAKDTMSHTIIPESSKTKLWWLHYPTYCTFSFRTFTKMKSTARRCICATSTSYTTFICRQKTIQRRVSPWSYMLTN